MSTPVYEALANSSVSWECASCGMPQFSTSLFNSFAVNTSNTFSTLTSNCSDDGTTTLPSPGPPMASSSPTHQASRRGHSVEKRKMRILTVNFQSARNKKEEISNLIDSSDPDIILGTETWLNSKFQNAELFPSNYELIRKDRIDGYGGVLIALKKDIIFERLHLDLDVEAIFIKISLARKASLIAGVLYRPPSSTPKYMEDLCQSIEDLHRQYFNSVCWIEGDLNLPDIDWETQSSSGNQNPLPVKQRFLTMVQDCDLQQIVSFPTRQNNCLDLFLTNRPTLLNKCVALPGISDHDIVLVESSAAANRSRPVKRKVFLWKHADMESLREDCLAFQQAFTDQFDRTSPVQAMWDNFKNSLLHLMEKHVPSKMTSTRFSQPWITRSLKQLTRRKKRCFDRAKASNTPEDYTKYLAVKKQTRKACRDAYHKYVEDIVSPDSTTNPKRFWSFINSKRCDSSGVAPLKSTDGSTYQDSASKCNILNSQFSSVFTRAGLVESSTDVAQQKRRHYPKTFFKAGIWIMESNGRGVGEG
ncbi:uncharacterized protein [Diadema setosum]|uniref:uncharacterized protein n=1 Tax=Diadema setosum TaxID=31175 RepID=UPI003B3A9B59